MIRFALMAILAFSAVAQAQAPGRDDSKHIVTFRQGTPQGERANAVQRAGGKLRFNYSTVDAVAITAATPNVLAALGREPSVLNIVPDRDVHAIQGATTSIRINRKGSTSGTTSTCQVIPQGVKRVECPRAHPMEKMSVLPMRTLRPLRSGSTYTERLARTTTAMELTSPGSSRHLTTR